MLGVCKGFSFWSLDGALNSVCFAFFHLLHKLISHRTAVLLLLLEREIFLYIQRISVDFHHSLDARRDMPFSSIFHLSNKFANYNKLYVVQRLFLNSAKSFSTPSPTVKRKNGPAKPINVDILGTWDTTNELPLELESSINYGKPIPQIRISSVGTHTIQGRRPYNEDRFVVKELKPNILYFAVFDGHGGSECADYCYTHMEDHLTFWIERLENDFEHAIDAAFLEVNNSFSRWWAYHGKGNSTQNKRVY